MNSELPAGDLLSPIWILPTNGVMHEAGWKSINCQLYLTFTVFIIWRLGF